MTQTFAAGLIVLRQPECCCFCFFKRRNNINKCAQWPWAMLRFPDAARSQTGVGVPSITPAWRVFANIRESFPAEYLYTKSKAARLRARRRAQDGIKSARARFCCGWLARRAVPIKCTSDLRRNQRSASNPVPSPSHKQHLNENIHGHLRREESHEGEPTWASHCFQLTRHWRARQHRNVKLITSQLEQRVLGNEFTWGHIRIISGRGNPENEVKQ